MDTTYTLHYNEEQLTKAARFVFAHNSSCSYWPTPCHNVDEVRQKIISDILAHGKRCVNVLKHSRNPDADWPWMTGTGGYYLIFTNDPGSTEILVDILVDPAVSARSSRYVVEYIETED